LEEENDKLLDTVRLLVDQARDGDAEAKSELATHVQSYLTMMADRGLSPAIRSNVNPSDIVQRTLIRMIDGIGNFRGSTRSEFFAWLTTIVHNESARANRHFRSQKRDVTREQSMAADNSSMLPMDPVDLQATPQTNALSKERVELFHSLLKRLPDDYAEVIMLRNLQQLSFREIGDKMDRTEGAAGKLWDRAISKFQQELNRMSEEADSEKE